jgi:hypothetical protein
VLKKFRFKMDSARNLTPDDGSVVELAVRATRKQSFFAVENKA